MSPRADGRLPWFRCWARDEYAAMVGLSEGARAALVMLERAAWFTEGGLPGEPAALARLAAMDVDRFREVWPEIRGRFAPHPDDASRLACPALEEQRANALEVSRARAAAGRKSGEARRNHPRRRRIRASNICSTHAQHMLNDPDPDPDADAHTRDVQDTSVRPQEAASTRKLREHVERALGHPVKPAKPEAETFLEGEIALHGEGQTAERCVEAGRRSPRPVLSMNYFARPGVLEGADRGPSRPQGRSTEGETNSSATDPTTGTGRA